MKSTIINGNKEFLAFSDFPMPDNFPNFMHNTKIMQYLHLYAEHFQLKQHVRFNQEVLSIRKSHDHDVSGAWLVRVRDVGGEGCGEAGGGGGGTVYEAVFPRVIVCMGLFHMPKIPVFQGQETFPGQQIHSHSYREPTADMKDKTVLVVGFANSAIDIACELAIVSKKVRDEKKKERKR